MQDVLTYEEYKAMGGTLAEPAFFRLSNRSVREIEYFTGKMIDDFGAYDEDDDVTFYGEKVKELVFELVSNFDRCGVLTAGQQKSSESNNGASVSYVQADPVAEKANRFNIVKQYLGAESVYMGVD